MVHSKREHTEKMLSFNSFFSDSNLQNTFDIYFENVLKVDLYIDMTWLQYRHTRSQTHTHIYIHISCKICMVCYKNFDSLSQHHPHWLAALICVFSSGCRNGTLDCVPSWTEVDA
jgi:hypothetical protein